MMDAGMMRLQMSCMVQQVLGDMGDGVARRALGIVGAAHHNVAAGCGC